eukprot:NODE_1701_length_1326_cov_26.470634_g1414_i0.p1 GENE.NODE_1701_length_1326_cov_26.470634_g1414_i0~~NODE_1701_length_1326_cov_26.470634_g1414_i0.p1  ORF type:complete len:297 (-),score=51.93 NODE_1701_length_1326_cov_26.470634_g1414_i0:47-937(-)
MTEPPPFSSSPPPPAHLDRSLPSAPGKAHVLEARARASEMGGSFAAFYAPPSHEQTHRSMVPGVHGGGQDLAWRPSKKPVAPTSSVSLLEERAVRPVGRMRPLTVDKDQFASAELQRSLNGTSSLHPGPPPHPGKRFGYSHIEAMPQGATGDITEPVANLFVMKKKVSDDVGGLRAQTRSSNVDTVEVRMGRKKKFPARIDFTATMKDVEQSPDFYAASNVRNTATGGPNLPRNVLPTSVVASRRAQELQDAIAQVHALPKYVVHHPPVAVETEEEHAHDKSRGKGKAAPKPSKKR